MEHRTKTAGVNDMPTKTLSRQSGFTLVELMVAIVVLAILIAIAVPSFKTQIQSSKMRTTTADFITAIAYARSQAVTRAENVHVRAKTGGWAAGWCVTVGGDCAAPLRDFEAPKGIAVSGTGTSYSFNQLGYLADAATTSQKISLCSDNDGKEISILQLGQALAQSCTCTSNVCTSTP